jgi:hypothetical protein
MPKFRLKPGEIDAVQFNGENWVEMAKFCGTRKNGDGDRVPVFNPVGTFLFTAFNPTAAGAKAELWVEYAKKIFHVKVGDWVVKGQPLGLADPGFHLMADRLFTQLYERIEE